jgi:translation initiation factor IF-2
MSVRVHNLSKQLNMENKELMAILKEQYRWDGKSPSATVDNITADAILEKFKDRMTPPAPEPVAAPVKPTAPPVGVVKTQEILDRERKEREAAEAAAKAAAAATRNPVSIAAPTAPLAAPKLPPRLPIPALPAKPTSFAPTPQSTGPAVRYPGMGGGGSGGQRSPSSVSMPSPSSAPKAKVAPPSRAPSLPPPTPKPSANPPPVKSAPLPAPAIAAAGKPPAPPSATPAVVSAPEPTGPGKIIQVKPPIIVRDFAMLLGMRPFQLIGELMEAGIFAQMNQAVDEEVAMRVARRHGCTLEIKHRGDQPGAGPAPAKKVEPPPEDDTKLREPRPPIVCVLGHVNHGKTTLLDAIRKTNVVAGEAGGITQHTGAYQIEHKDHKITFLDTPGHAAFSKMRERGANITDIAVLVVAADDGFMPQTEEALSFAQKAGVPVIVAINKMDAKGANLDRVKQAMQQHGITSEDWGGETLCEPVSALKGQNVDKLLDAILLQAEVLELKANPKCPAEGVVIDSQVEMGRGATATVIVEKGTLKPGDALVCGAHYCKVRAMVNDRGEPLKSVPPGTPARLLGWSGAPDAGAQFHTCKNDRAAKAEAEAAERELRQVSHAENVVERVADLNALLAAIKETKQKVFRCVIKGDVHGTVEALEACLMDIKSEKVQMEIVAADVGPVSPNDVIMASAAGAAVIAFNVKLENGVASTAKHKGVRVIQHDIIYELLNQVREAMAELLDPELRENKIGAAEVRQVFPLAKGFVAGCMVTEGRVTRAGHARILRKGATLYTGKVDTLKRFKDDASEVRAGFECGLHLGGFEDYQPGDIIESFEILQMKASL